MANSMPPGQEAPEPETESVKTALRNLCTRFRRSAVIRKLVAELRELRQLIRTNPLVGVGTFFILAFLSLPIFIYILFVIGAILIGLTGFLCFEGILVGTATFFLMLGLFGILLLSTGVILFTVYLFTFFHFLVQACQKINGFFNPWNVPRQVPAVENVPSSGRRHQD